MRFELEVGGIKVSLKIKGYEHPDKTKWDYQWCQIDLSLAQEPWLNYQKTNDEVLLSCEVKYLANALDELLSDKYSEPLKIEGIEPDFCFVLHPKRDLRNDPRYAYIREGCEIADIYMDWKTFFWNMGITDNHLSITFGRFEIEQLRNYLFWVIGKINNDDPIIAKMVDEGILVPT